MRRPGLRGGAGLLLLLVISILVLVVYAQVRHHEFLQYDDDLFITGNPNIQQGLNWTSVKWAFTNNHAALWFPLLWLSHLVDSTLFGMQAGWHHLHNLGLHWINSILLLVVMYRMTGRIWASGLMALLFAVHPQHVESVAWVTERKDTLSTVFLLLTVFFYHRYTLHRTRRRYLAVFLFLVLGLMTKPMLVTLPFALLLLDYWPLGRLAGSTWGPGDRTGADLVREKLPFFAVVLVLSVVTYLVGKSGGIVSDQDMVPLRFRLVNSLNSYGQYLREFVWPNGLYAQHQFQIPIPWPRLALVGGVLAGMSFLAVRWRRSRPYFLTGWLWYLGTLIPVLGLIQQGGHSMADRYTYTSFVGITLIVVWGLADLQNRFRLPRPLMAAVAVCVIAGLTWSARIQAGYWRNTETLFVRTLQMEPDNDFALNKLGDFYKKAGRQGEAAEMYARSMQVNPHAAHAGNNLAGLMAEAGQWDKALDLYRQALAGTGERATVHYNMGILLQKMGRYDEAAASYGEALELEDDHFDAMTNLGLTYLAQGRFVEAAAQLDRLAVLQPDNPTVRYNLACVASRSGRIDEAVSRLKEAVALGFDDWQTLASDPDLANLRQSPAFPALDLPVPAPGS